MAKWRRFVLLPLTLLSTLAFAGTMASCAKNDGSSQSLVIYSGRSEEFIAPFLAEFTAETGISLDVRYGDSAALAAQILEEGTNSPADIFLSQDAGALGAVSGEGLLQTLDSSILNRVDQRFRSAGSDWVGITGRVRVFAYSPDRVYQLPKTIDDLIKPEWKARIGIAPTNSSFQAFVTAMIQSRGEAKTESWLRSLVANSAKYYEKNSLIVQAIDAGEIDAGLVNHYYIWEVSEELGRNVNVRVKFFEPGDIGNLINVSGAGILNSSAKVASASKLIKYLLADRTQKRFVSETHEYSIVLPGLQPEDLPALSEISAPEINLAELADLKRTQALLIKVGMI